jgi:hypothetical protein
LQSFLLKGRFLAWLPPWLAMVVVVVALGFSLELAANAQNIS